MADDSAQEKTEEATPRRLEKAREEGQVPRSKELTTSAVLIAGTVGLVMFGGVLAGQLMKVIEFNFNLSREAIFDTSQMFAQLGASFWYALLGLIPFFAIVLLAAVAGPVALGGWLFSAKALAPKLDRIDPMKGLGRMFSAKSLVELVKAIGKVLIVIAVAYFVMQATKESLMGLADEGVQQGIVHSVTLSAWAAVIISCATIFIAMIDIPFQIYDHAKKLKMSRQDIKDEMKDTEGKPEVKGKIRQMQMQMAQNRMMQSVPEADVVITNPTHYSVALKYKPDMMDTPILVAKGVDHIALKIREVAKLNEIDFVESPALARSIYHTTEIDQEIPQGLYLAVAQVLAYVFQLRDYRKGRGEKPKYPRSPQIPPDLRYD
ncbi:flagellar biosynthesis protein FlhB [Teredinibacter sp. KSP-S5-2]|uniref:flagellar biosynthesis protein FlhB n=1 Tax=Teredinibacter sp. KSP-S5-2 TaxID=3034506 RepID=UPI002934DC84|nr:flagellar biosynthesis protein FlhB [Teredinibacter sp. KSP-S5-2]WNO07898.1 flagellar biosynthesis protein FlhB [Teredinibacter sp. KSP-S5-2]